MRKRRSSGRKVAALTAAIGLTVFLLVNPASNQMLMKLGKSCALVSAGLLNVGSERTVTNLTAGRQYQSEDVEESVPDSSAEPRTGTSSTIAYAEEGTPPKQTKDSGKVVEETIGFSNYVTQKVAINNKTDVDPDVAKQLSQRPSYHIQKNNQPQILIMHTHTTEAYMTFFAGFYNKTDSTRSMDHNRSVVGVGERLAETLRGQGFCVLHDTTVHDSPEYSGAYTRSLSTVQAILKKNPTIKIVIDVHRDAIQRDASTKCKPTVMVNGKKAAQVLLITSIKSYAATPHPNWQQNLRTTLRIQNQIASDYTGLARPMHLVGLRYNQHTAPGAFLLEVGTDANTVSEALYSAELVGKSMGKVLNTLT